VVHSSRAPAGPGTSFFLLGVLLCSGCSQLLARLVPQARRGSKVMRQIDLLRLALLLQGAARAAAAPRCSSEMQAVPQQDASHACA
jgi:predicted membrane channel-forming protein YqfA (hemolysin III family)